MDRKAFLDQEAPPGYIAGVGRGATGFTTGADTGSLRFEPDNDEHDSDERETEDVEEENDDGLLSTAVQNRESKDEEEADKIYNQLELRLQLRHKRKMEVATTDGEDEITKQFADLKRELAGVSNSEWAHLPEASDFTRRNKRARLLEQLQRRFYALPDTVIANAGSIDNQHVKSGATDFESISQARDKILSSQLDELLPQAAGDTDTKALAEDVDDKVNDTALADIEKGRLIFASLRKAEPYKSSSWIASARLEEKANNYIAAKKFIIEGCRKASRSEDVWLENIRIHMKTTEGTRICKNIIKEALKYNPASEKLWNQACDLENSTDGISRKKVLMRGLEFNPTYVSLWRRLIDLTDDTHEVQKLLNKAVELCPNEWNFWLMLINLSNYENARKVINRARSALKPNYLAWIAAAKLEEREHEDISIKKIGKLVKKGLEETYAESGIDHENFGREKWFTEAARAESEGFLKSCEAIVNVILDYEKETAEGTLKEWLQEANNFSQKNHKHLSNFIYTYITRSYPHDVDCWIEMFLTYKSIEDFDINELFTYYQLAISENPSIEIFRLMFAKDVWILGRDIKRAKVILDDSIEQLSQSEDLWFARMKLDIKDKDFPSALRISEKMLETIPNSSARVWYKHIHIRRYLNLLQQSEEYKSHIIQVCDKALERFPDCDKLYLQKGQIFLDDLGDVRHAYEVFREGTTKCRKSQSLWLTLAMMEEKYNKSLILARSVLDKASLAFVSNDMIWVSRIELESRAQNYSNADQLCSKALKLFPHSPLIWKQRLKLIKKASFRRNAFLDALKSTNNSPIILMNIGVFFWVENKLNKAKTWFERALNADKTNGDCWCWLYNFISTYGTEDEKHDFLSEFEQQFENIVEGQVWNLERKQLSMLDKSAKEILESVCEKLKSDPFG